jgi:hypothetical protein
VPVAELLQSVSYCSRFDIFIDTDILIGRQHHKHARWNFPGTSAPEIFRCIRKMTAFAESCIEPMPPNKEKRDFRGVCVPGQVRGIKRKLRSVRDPDKQFRFCFKAINPDVLVLPFSRQARAMI